MRLSRNPCTVVVVPLVLTAACRSDPTETELVETGQFGAPGSGYTCQCSGWFPDWISSSPPPAGVEAFQLSQGYPLGIPVLENVGGVIRVARWDPPPPAEVGPGAPWLAFDFEDPIQRAGYLEALVDYAFDGMPEADFVAQENAVRRWYHVPMMTTSPFSRREPYRGTTKERPLRASEHDWIQTGEQLDSFAIGFYNGLGGYTIGQVFGDPDPSLADPSKAVFIDGAFVFKLIFAEHDQAKIVAASDPFVDAPSWDVQDIAAPAAPLKEVRLVQVDIAVKDPRATETGWVFATFVYDKRKTSEPVAWRRLTAVGLQWGNDPDVTALGVGVLDESWSDEPALPTYFQDHLGRHGRLNGPVDNPASSCLSCHSTGQVVPGAASLSAFRGARLIPPGSCSDAQDMTWFRNLVGGVAFGVMSGGGDGCSLTSSPLPVISTDYSLQLADALESALFYENPNPCAGTSPLMAMATAGPDERHRGDAAGDRRSAPVRVDMDVELMTRMNRQPAGARRTPRPLERSPGESEAEE